MLKKYDVTSNVTDVYIHYFMINIVLISNPKAIQNDKEIYILFFCRMYTILTCMLFKDWVHLDYFVVYLLYPVF